MAYWVQIEFKVSGKNTGAMQLDLEQVKRIHIKRQDNQIEGLVIKYADEPGFGVDEVVAEQFLKYWAEYQEQQGGLKRKSEEQRAGTIYIGKAKGSKSETLSAV
jgi:hypothetical protein